MVDEKFTGKERDAESGLDYFGARYMSAVQGRFTSPDEPLVDQYAGDPQSWNLYTYGRNNPLKFTDPTGRSASVIVETDEENKRGTITVKASVALYAAGLGQKAGERYAKSVKDQITKQWSGSFEQGGIQYGVRVEIDATFHQSESDALKSGADNVVELRSGPWDVDSSGQGTAGEVAPRPMGYSGPDRWTLAIAGPAGHEFGHSMGIGIFGGVHHGGHNLMSAGSPASHATASDYAWAFGPSVNRHRADQAVNPSLRGQPSSFRLQARPNYWIGR
ncbi:MAG: RHS repeat-associated core domain-containing protein [Bryobacterales bacterium]|nr:RHS repeat-associated core domain-containing protein [Bryobacterales bacterium]